MELVIIGAGSWGTALARAFSRSLEHDVRLVVRNSAVVQEINAQHTNSDYLPGIVLPESLTAIDENDYSALASLQPDVVFFAIPAQSVRAYLDRYVQLGWDAPLVSLAKGIEHDTNLRITEVIAEKLRPKYFGVLSGPNLAMEVAADMPCSAALALQSHVHNDSLELAQKLAPLLSTSTFVVVPSGDVVGCEIAGAAKNIIALACGIAVGVGYGDNSQAAIITEGFREITALAAALGGNAGTLLSPAGLGDLAATCYSDLSRNRSFGQQLGSRSVEIAPEGSSPTWFLPTMGKTVEAVPTSEALVNIAKRHGVEVPVMYTVSEVLSGRISPVDAVHIMVNSTKSKENHEKILGAEKI